MNVTVQIYYHDTDAGGVVYYGRYLNFLEEARTHVLDTLGFNVKQLNDDGYIFAVRHCHLHYQYPARYGDRLTCFANVCDVSRAKIIFDQPIVRDDGVSILKANVELICLNRDFKPCKMPQPLFEQLLELKNN